MSTVYCLGWIMVFLRSIGVILQLPVIAGRSLPIMFRVGISACLASVLAGIVPVADVPITLTALGYAAGAEVMLGLIMGFMTRLTFDAVEMAGRIISPEIGLTATPGLGVPQPATESTHWIWPESFCPPSRSRFCSSEVLKSVSHQR